MLTSEGPAMTPWPIHTNPDKKIEVSKNHIILICEPTSEIVEAYQGNFSSSKIVTPSKSLVV